jgi:hypothetical protein
VVTTQRGGITRVVTRKRKTKIDGYELVGRDPDTGLIYLSSVDEIPVFASDEEEVEFWETHEATMDFYGPTRKSLAEALAEA